MLERKIYKKYYPIGKYTIISENDTSIFKQMQRRYFNEKHMIDMIVLKQAMKGGISKIPYTDKYEDQDDAAIYRLHIPVFGFLDMKDAYYTEEDIKVLNFLLLWNKYNVQITSWHMALSNKRHNLLFYSEKPTFNLYIPIIKKKKIHFIKIKLKMMPEVVKVSLRKIFAKLVYIASEAECDCDICSFYIKQADKIKYILKQISEEINKCIKSENPEAMFMEMNIHLDAVKEYMDDIYADYEKIKKLAKERKEDIKSAMNQLDSLEQTILDNKKNNEMQPFFEVSMINKMGKDDIDILKRKYRGGK